MSDIPETLALTSEDCTRVVDMIGMLSGGGEANIFAWDDADNPSDPDTQFWARIYLMAGERVPLSLRNVFSDGEQKESAK